MIQGFIILVALQLFGDFVSEQFSLSVPGSVIGMLLLLLILILRTDTLNIVSEASDGLIKYIGLLFVPAGAGISLYLGFIAENWIMITAASVLSTIVTLVFVAGIFKILTRGDES